MHRIKKGFLLIFVIFFAVLLAGIAFGSGTSSKLDSRVLSELATQQKVKVYVEFNTNKNKISTLSNDKKALSSELGINFRHEFGNIASLEATAEDIANLENNPDVEKIAPIPELQVFLYDSVNLTNATLAWTDMYNGMNLTGKGQTVCILDTGVNYSHPDLGGCFGAGCKVMGGYDMQNADSNPMDDHGHGTHVSGIVAANGTITGIAPGANIVMIKVCDSGGSCGEDNIRAGIDWCVGNMSVYNISVISMSLGGGNYSSYCDGVEDTFDITGAINRATAKDIPVVIATGNSKNSTAIAFPACIENATPVSATTKADAIDISYAQRSMSMLQLLAPGTSITSTYLSSTGGYASGTGTSMATPHVAGAIAILKEYLNLTGRIKTPQQIESILNSTGKLIFDSATNAYYSRINVHDALISLDGQSPNVSLMSPNNALQSNSVNQTFRCNATDLELRNVTFFLWNSSGVYNQTNQSILSSSYIFEANITSIPYGNYSWNCLFYDHNSSIFALSNFSISVLPYVNVSLSYPADNFRTKTNRTYQCNASTNLGFSNVTLFLWNSTGIEINISNSLAGFSNFSVFSFNFTHEDNYKWNCFFTTNTSQSNFAAANYSIAYDLTKPVLNVTSPINASYYNAGKFNVSLNENGSCWYSLGNWAANVSFGTTDSQNFGSVNTTLADSGVYTIVTYCNDTVGNLAWEKRNFTIDLIAPIVSLISPADGYSVTTSSATVAFSYNTSDILNISSCSLILNGAILDSNSSITNQSQTLGFSETISSGSYTWGINCTDIAGNQGNSSSRSFTINAPAAAPSGGGGGSGGGTSTGLKYTISAVRASEGYSVALSAEDQISFDFPAPAAAPSGGGGGGSSVGVQTIKTGEKHSVIVNKVGVDFVNITIRSDPINLILQNGEERKFNLTSADYYDLLVRVNNITNSKANITVKTINEPIVSNNINTENKTSGGLQNESVGGINAEKSEAVKMAWAIGIFALIFVGLYICFRFLEKKKSR